MIKIVSVSVDGFQLNLALFCETVFKRVGLETNFILTIDSPLRTFMLVIISFRLPRDSFAHLFLTHSLIGFNDSTFF